MYKKFGFTLAEILLTLLIIGVIVSLILPNLINDTQDAEFHTLFKKDFSLLSDSTKKMILDNGGALSGLFTNSNAMLNYFDDYMSFSKKCFAGEQGCFYAGTNTWKTLSNRDGWHDHTTDATAVLNDGQFIMFRLNRTPCNYDYETGTPAEYSCGWLHVDVNGYKPPNMLGKDLYSLCITNTGIYPCSMGGCSKTSLSTYSGWGCNKVVLSGGNSD